MCMKCCNAGCHCDTPKIQNTPHKHAALIKAWADGATIEYQKTDGTWTLPYGQPGWGLDDVYRIKPVPKPDVIIYSNMSPHGSLQTSPRHVTSSNVQYTFDGETGKLKSVCLL